RFLPAKSYGVEALILLGSGTLPSGPCFPGVFRLSFFLSVTIWVTSLGRFCEASTSQTSVLPQSFRGPQMVHYTSTLMRRAAGAHSSGSTEPAIVLACSSPIGAGKVADA